MDSEDIKEEPGGDSVGAGMCPQGREGYRMTLGVELEQCHVLFSMTSLGSFLGGEGQNVRDGSELPGKLFTMQLPTFPDVISSELCSGDSGSTTYTLRNSLGDADSPHLPAPQRPLLKAEFQAIFEVITICGFQTKVG